MRIWWNGRHAGLRSQCRKAWGFKSLYPHQMTRECSDSSSHQKVRHSINDGPGRCDCGRERVAGGINPTGGVFWVCPTQECEKKCDNHFMLM